MASIASAAATKIGKCGIDFGTSACKVAACNGESLSDLDAKVIVDPMGDFSIASYVAVDDEGGYVVGNTARQQMERRAKYTVAHVKKSLGVEGGTVSLVTNLGKKVVVAPEKIASILLNQVVSVASEGEGVDMKNAVVAVPHGCSEARLKAMAETAKQSGLNVLQFISESSAVALAYGLDEETTEAGNYLIVDIGFEATRVSVLSASNGFFSVKHFKEIAGVGGNAMSERIVALCVRDFMDKHGKDLKDNGRAMLKLQAACEHAKHTLSVSTRAVVEVDALADGVDFRKLVNQASFESECSDLFTKMLEGIGATLKDAGLAISDVKNVLLAGGSSQMPRVKSMLAQVFNKPELEKETSGTVNPSEAVALGAARQATLLCMMAENNVEEIQKVVGGETNPTVMSLALTVGVEQKNGLIVPVFSRGNAVPASRTITLEHGSASTLKFYTGERPSAAGNFLLGMADVGEAKGSRTFTLSVDKSGQNFTLLVGEKEVNITFVGAVETLSKGDVAAHVSSCASDAAAKEDARARAVADLNDFIYKVQESDYLQDIEEEDTEIVDKKVAETTAQVGAAGDVESITALLKSLTTCVDDILAEYDEEDEEEDGDEAFDGGDMD